jgi:hypothetical protein
MDSEYKELPDSLSKRYLTILIISATILLTGLFVINKLLYLTDI